MQAPRIGCFRAVRNTAVPAPFRREGTTPAGDSLRTRLSCGYFPSCHSFGPRPRVANEHESPGPTKFTDSRSRRYARPASPTTSSTSTSSWRSPRASPRRAVGASRGDAGDRLTTVPRTRGVAVVQYLSGRPEVTFVRGDDAIPDADGGNGRVGDEQARLSLRAARVFAMRLSIWCQDAQILQRRFESGFEVAEGCGPSQLGDRLTLGNRGQQRARLTARVVGDPAQGGVQA